MLERASFAYAQARMQAHHGRRPTKATWRYLNSSKSLGHYLDSARQTGLKRWVVHFSGTTDTHVIEATLRREWRAYVAMLCAWIPREWRPAAHWVGELVDLPLATHVARGQGFPAWGERDVAVSPHHQLGWAGPQPPLSVWGDHFKALLPSSSDGPTFKNLFEMLRRDYGADQPANTLDGIELRYQLIARMERMFRRHAQQPVAVFSFFAMVAMDVEHLRAHLIHRCLFPATLEHR